MGLQRSQKYKNHYPTSRSVYLLLSVIIIIIVVREINREYRKIQHGMTIIIRSPSNKD